MQSPWTLGVRTLFANADFQGYLATVLPLLPGSIRTTSRSYRASTATQGTALHRDRNQPAGVAGRTAVLGGPAALAGSLIEGHQTAFLRADLDDHPVAVDVRGRGVTVVPQVVLLQPDGRPLLDVKAVVQVDGPHLLPPVAGVPAVQVAVAAEGVKVSRIGVILGRGGRPGVDVLVPSSATAVLGALVGDGPDRLSRLGLQAADVVLPALPAHDEEAAAGDQRRGASFADLRLPDRLLVRPMAVLPTGVFLDDIVALRTCASGASRRPRLVPEQAAESEGPPFLRGRLRWRETSLHPQRSGPRCDSSHVILVDRRTARS